MPLSPPEVPLLTTPLSAFVEPILDVRTDFTDPCQIDRSDNRWFLLFVDKSIEYVSKYNTKTRSNPLRLLKEFLDFTGRKIQYLRMDNKAHYQAFFWVLIDLIVELLGLIIKPFDNQTES
jgi:hypothetical protein